MTLPERPQRCWERDEFIARFGHLLGALRSTLPTVSLQHPRTDHLPPPRQRGSVIPPLAVSTGPARALPVRAHPIRARQCDPALFLSIACVGSHQSLISGIPFWIAVHLAPIEGTVQRSCAVYLAQSTLAKRRKIKSLPDRTELRARQVQQQHGRRVFAPRSPSPASSCMRLLTVVMMVAGREDRRGLRGCSRRSGNAVVRVRVRVRMLSGQRSANLGRPRGRRGRR